MTFTINEVELCRAVSNACWEHPGSKSDGYGIIKRAGRLQLAHRYHYQRILGAVVDGLELDHRCCNRACVNPNHLQPSSHRDNTLRGVGPTAINAAKTHCSRGHEFTQDNTILRTTGGRRCRECNNANVWRKRKQPEME
jgi:hypothetical protein